ncbi:hypothetical protein ANN_19055 [Periplaneta americana]|uniref:Reverse transcriptase n=1 Tax=Periplaneta americana TaxID=6978 RepID=A0ABQ8SQG3_PERAM|nr:hypothetical protein ANN_19055 [Periplaneta americana]
MMSKQAHFLTASCAGIKRQHPGCNETETLGHVLGFCRKTELLRNNRHHKARTGIADLLKRRGWEVHEEVHCVSSLDSNRRGDIVAIHRTQSKGLVLDPTIRFERDALQAQHVDEEKKSIYESCIPYLSEKYNIPTSQWNVSGLLFGARGTLPKFTCDILKALGLRFFEIQKILIMCDGYHLILIEKILSGGAEDRTLDLQH